MTSLLSRIMNAAGRFRLVTAAKDLYGRYDGRDVSGEARDSQGRWIAGPELSKDERKQLRSIADEADEKLRDESSTAIESFVGHPTKSRDSFWSGIMNARKLEDAFSPSPSELGQTIKSQMEEAMKPVRDKLKSLYGDHVTLYRGQDDVAEDSTPRNVLSWSFNPKVAADFVDVRGWNALSNEEIRNAIHELKEKKEVQIGRQIYRDTDEGIDLFNAANDCGGEEFITNIGESIGEFAQWLRSEQSYQREDEHRDQKKRQKVMTRKVSIDDIVWLTDRANQLEAIVKTHSGNEQGSPMENQSRVQSAKDRYYRRPTTMSMTEINRNAAETETPKSDEHREAGNYKKGHLRIHGLNISIENPRWSVRSGVNAQGIPWSVTMKHHYGYLKGTIGADGQHLDCFIGDSPTSQVIWIVDQKNAAGQFDEAKVMIGFESEAEAKEAYFSNYSKGWNGFMSCTAFDVDHFKIWLAEGDTSNPVARYAKRINERNDIMKTPNCPYCDSPNTNNARTTGNGNAVCHDCKHVFTDHYDGTASKPERESTIGHHPDTPTVVDFGSQKPAEEILENMQAHSATEDYSKRIERAKERYKP